MATIVADRVADTTETTGTVPFVMDNAEPTGYRNFDDVCADADLVYYSVSHRLLDQWEVGKATYNSGNNTLTRTLILASSNDNSAVNFSAGIKDVVGSIPALILSQLVDGSFGTSAMPLSSLYFASGAFIDWNSGDGRLTHSSNALALTGVDLGITARATTAIPLTLNQFSNAQSVPLLNFHLSSITTSNAGRKLWSVPAADTQNGVPFNFGSSHYKFIGSGVGSEDYWNEVAFVGWNASAEGIRATSGKAAIWDAWEYKFNQGESDYFLERHMQTLNSTGSGGVRYFSFSVRHDGGASRGFFFSDYFDFIDRTGAFGPVRISATTTSGQINLSNCVLYSETNNISFIQAKNAALNDNVACLRVDASDRLIIGDNNAVSAGNWLNGTTSVAVAPVATAWLKIAAGTTAKAQINLPAGTAPTSPVDGDIYSIANTDVGLKARLNSNTRTFAFLESTNVFTSTLQATAFKVATIQVVGAQGALVADASGGAVIDAEARTALNALLARLRTHGLIAT